MDTLNVCIVTGARPNFVKVAPLVRAIGKARSAGKAIGHALVYTGRGDDPALGQALFDELELARPDACLGVDCRNLNELTGRVMSEFDRYLESNPTDIVIVVDDLAATMAVAIVTKKRGVRLAHLVAGTRSFDIRMPKEINRLVIDGLSDILFTAGMSGNSIVSREKSDLAEVYMVGNILMDTLRSSRPRMARPDVMERLGLEGGDYLVFTLNRSALMADRENLRLIVDALLSAAGRVKVVAPLRPEAQSVISPMASSHPNFHVVEPLSYLGFGYLTANALGIVTDSDNVAEEATFNSVPCASLSTHAEHVETVSQGTNVLVGEDPVKLSAALADMIGGRWKKSSLPQGWDGHAAERMVQILLHQSA